MLNFLISLVFTSAAGFSSNFKINDSVYVVVSAENELSIKFPASEPDQEYYLITHDVSKKTAWYFEPTGEVEVFPAPIVGLLHSVWGDIKPVRSGWTENGRLFAMMLVRGSDIATRESAFKSYTQAQFAIKGETVEKYPDGVVKIRFPLAEIMKRAENKPDGVKPNIVLLYPGQIPETSGYSEIALPLSKLNEMAAGARCELSFMR